MFVTADPFANNVWIKTGSHIWNYSDNLYFKCNLACISDKAGTFSHFTFRKHMCSFSFYRKNYKVRFVCDLITRLHTLKLFFNSFTIQIGLWSMPNESTLFDSHNLILLNLTWLLVRSFQLNVILISTSRIN